MSWLQISHWYSFRIFFILLWNHRWSTYVRFLFLLVFILSIRRFLMDGLLALWGLRILLWRCVRSSALLDLLCLTIQGISYKLSLLRCCLFCLISKCTFVGLVFLFIRWSYRLISFSSILRLLFCQLLFFLAGWILMTVSEPIYIYNSVICYLIELPALLTKNSCWLIGIPFTGYTMQSQIWTNLPISILSQTSTLFQREL